MNEPALETTEGPNSSQNPVEIDDSDCEVVEVVAPHIPPATSTTTTNTTTTITTAEGPTASDITKLLTQSTMGPQTPFKTPLKLPLIPLQHSNTNTTSTNTPSPLTEKKMTPKQLEKIKEREEREKRKLEEKITRDKAKEEERLLKEQKRLQKEAEKKARDDERERIRLENEMKRDQLKKEKEDREKMKLEEKQKREDERRQQNEEKLKKLEEQKKLEEDAKKKKERLKISNFFKPKTTLKSTTVSEPTAKQENNYKTLIQDFFVRDGVVMHDSNRLTGDELRKAVDDFDQGLEGPSDAEQWLKDQSLETLIETPHDSKYIFDNQLAGAAVFVKFIKFYENVKCWIGTYTKSTPEGLGKTPFIETIEFIDFDDEAGEDEEGEGEDIDDDDDASDADEQDTEDLQDFLEDDNSNGDTRRAIGPLIPVITWKGKSTTDSLFTETVIRVEIIKADVSFPIDPKNDYWTSPLLPEPTEQSQTTVAPTEEQPKQKKLKTIITVKDDLEVFASKVQDCDFTVPTMVEILKKELPKYTKATIENTLRTLAKRVGPKPADKKWEVDRELLNQSVEAAES